MSAISSAKNEMISPEQYNMEASVDFSKKTIAIYCLIPIISHSKKKQNYKARKNINACQGLGGMNKEKTGFLG